MMKNLLIFLTGAAVGAAAYHVYINSRYDFSEDVEYVDDFVEEEEIEVETKADETENDSKKASVEKVETKAPIDDYVDYVRVAKDYTTYSNDVKVEPNDTEDKTVSAIRIIDADMLGEDGYEVSELTLYANKIITDEYDEPFEDVAGRLGLENIEAIGDDDSICIRNEDEKMDYEILRVLENFEEE